MKGVFILKRGLVKLTAGSSEGKTQILSLVRPGMVIGLSAVISETPYESSAIAIQRCQTGFIPLTEFSHFLANHIEAYSAVSKNLIEQQNATMAQLRVVGLGTSASGRLARLLVEWSVTGEQNRSGIHMLVPLTHEEIGEFIGATRESVSRTLSQFRNRRLIAFRGSTLTIFDLPALKRIGAETKR